jgi:hyaluronoglucosaminidase
VTAVHVVTVEPFYDPLHRRLSDEHFHITDAGGDGGVRVEISSPRGRRWALDELARRGAEGELVGDIVGGPAFAVRGVIEGFYGTPWPDEARLDMIEFCAAHRFNTFMYAPKDDPFLRERWREPYDSDGEKRLRAVIEHCHAVDVAAMVGVSPGLSMQYSSGEDRRYLDAKLRFLAEAGVDRLVLQFDDIPRRLQHGADRARFSSLAAAHADVANEVADALAGAIGWERPLVVCPTVYCGAGDEDYVVALGSRLDGRIDVLWTGRAICSPAITAAEAVAFARGALRPPLYWDNYPVNDVAMIHEAHLGPYLGRDPLLDRFSVGVLANAMEDAEASKIALATIADYLWDPAGYDPEESWERAIAEVGGGDAAALRAFADTVRGSCLAEPDPVELSAELERFEFELAHGDAAAARARLADVAERLAAAAATLRSPDAANPRLRRELEPWLDKFAVGAEAVAALAAVAGEPEPDPAAVAELRRLRGELRRRPHVVFGTVLEMAIDHVLPPQPEEEHQ